MKAILHIGAPKTGTTTLQYFLVKNHQALRKQNIFIPAYADTYASHIKLAVATYLPDVWESQPGFSFLGHHFYHCHVKKNFPSLEKEKKTLTPDDQERLWEEYRREIETNCTRDDLVIFSSEHLAGFHDNYEAERVKKLMDSLFDDITIVLYLRRQPEYLVSYYSTSICWHGAPWTFGEHPHSPAYDKLLKRWSIFGKDKIKVRLFDKQELHNHDIFSDFAATVGFDMAGLERVENQNETTLNSAETEFLRLFNSHVPRLLDPWTLNAGCDQVLSILFSRRNNPKEKQKAWHLNREEARQILEQYREGNDWVAREYLGREKLFDEDVSMYPETVASPHGLTIEKCVEITAHIYKELQAEKLRQNEEICRLQGEVLRLQALPPPIVKGNIIATLARAIHNVFHAKKEKSSTLPGKICKE